MGTSFLVLGEVVYGVGLAEDLEREGYQAEYLPGLGDEKYSPSSGDLFEAVRRKLKKKIGNQVCIHPGVGSLCERPQVLQAARELGMEVLAPTGKLVSLFSNKLNFLSAADSQKVEHLVLGFDPMQSLRELSVFLKGDENFPVVLKSLKRGSCGVLSCLIESRDDLEKLVPRWLEKVRLQVGEGIFYVEKGLREARKISVPFARSWDGSLEFLPWVDHTVESMGRPLLDLCPSPDLGADKVGQSIRDTTTRFVEHVNYIGVGSLEFLVGDLKSYLIGGVPGLDSTYRTWEKVLGCSAVRLQTQIFSGKSVKDLSLNSWEESPMKTAGVYFYTEDSFLQIPRPGFVFENGSIDQREGVSQLPSSSRVFDQSIRGTPGEEITIDDNGSLGACWLSSSGSNSDLLKQIRKAVGKIWISGSIQTNQAAICEMIEHPWIQANRVSSDFNDFGWVNRGRTPPSVAKLMSSIAISIRPRKKETLSSFALGIDRVSIDDCFEVKWVNEPQTWIRSGYSGLSGYVEFENLSNLRVSCCEIEENRWQVKVGVWESLVRGISREKPDRLIPLYAQAKGRIHSILYQKGSEIPAHDPIIIVESQQSLVPHLLPISIVLETLDVKAEQRVEIGQILGHFKRGKNCQNIQEE